MKKHTTTLLLFSIMVSFIFSQKAEVITQQINVENAIRGKVERTVEKFLDPSQYIVIVNARLEYKPLAVDSIKDPNAPAQQTTSPYTLVPGLDMPSIPTKQNIYQPDGSFNYSTDKYFLYGMEITIYVDEDISTGSLQQNIKTLIRKNIPEISDCPDCVLFETISLSEATTKNSRHDELLEQIKLLEEDRRDAEARLQNWRFERLEDELAASEDARTKWEDQARNKEDLRRIDDSTRMANLQSIEKKYREKQDSLYILTSIKLDEALRGRIESEEHTKKELLGLIKMQIQGEDIASNGISDDTRSDLYTKRPMPTNRSMSGQMWLMIVGVGILFSILLVVISKNKKTVYLKPKSSPPQQPRRTKPWFF